MTDPYRKDENDDEEDEEDFWLPGRSAFIFLIDAFLWRDRENFDKCMECVTAAILSKILTREKDLIGVVFFNTKNSPEPKDKVGMERIVVRDNTAVFIPVKEMSKPMVDYYMNFIKGGDYFDFENVYGYARGNLANALWLCTNMLKRTGFKLQQSSIVLFTDNDKPCASDREFQLYIQKASDLQQNDIDFDVVPIVDEFDYDKFYKEFICTVRDTDPAGFQSPNPEDERQLIAERLVRLNYKKRCNYNLKWTLGNDVQLSVSLYNLHRNSIYPKSVKLNRDDNKIVIVKRPYKNFTTDDYENNIADGTYCQPGDMRKSITVGGEKITFTEDELANMRGPLPPQLRLLGFKPFSTVNELNFIKTPAFLYPNENFIAGSTKLFRALWEKCLEKEKAAICVIVPRRKVSPCYIALMPTRFDDTTKDLFAPKDGFQVVYLPFEIDFRNYEIEDDNIPIIPDEDVDLFKKVVRKLKSKFSAQLFNDPSLKFLHDKILALAFEVEYENSNETEIPNVQLQDEKIKLFADQILNKFGKDDEDTTKKRRATNTESKPAKQPRTRTKKT